MATSVANALGQKRVFSLMIFILSLILAVVSLALQMWFTQETDRYKSRLGLVQRCHRLKIPPLDEECYSSISVDCNNEDYISQAGLMKQANCNDTMKTLQLCLGLMVTALVLVIVAVILSVPGLRRHTAIASVCGFVAGTLFLVALGIFRYVPKQDFAYTYFEGEACPGASFGLAGGAMFAAFCGGFVSAIVSWQERSISAEKKREENSSTTTDGLSKEKSRLYASQSQSSANNTSWLPSASNVEKSLPGKEDDNQMCSKWQDVGVTSSVRHRHAESGV